MSTREQFKLWGKVALYSFGGPAGQIAVIHKFVVEEKKLISEERFLHALNFCMFLPGPEAQQLATYIGWMINRQRGGLIAGGLFILPGFISILGLSYFYIFFHHLSLIQSLFYGIKPAIIAIVLGGLYRISKKSLQYGFHWILASFAFLALFLFKISFPYVILGAFFIGVVYGKWFSSDSFAQEVEVASPIDFKQTTKTFCTWVFIWLMPIVIVFILFGEGSTFHQLNLFFSKMSLVTFGGAYAVLSYVAQQSVEIFGWVRGSEMLDGLGMAETTPGPLIQVVQFVGFMGAYRFPDLASPYLSALFGSILTVWMTFSPCFLWIFTFAPYVEFLRSKKIISDGLGAITAAVVGVILNLSLWFVMKVIFRETIFSVKFPFHFEYPIFSSIDIKATFICGIALCLQFFFKKGLFVILGVCTFLGVIAHFVF